MLSGLVRCCQVLSGVVIRCQVLLFIIKWLKIFGRN